MLKYGDDENNPRSLFIKEKLKPHLADAGE